MEYIVIALLVVAVLAFIAYPLFTGTAETPELKANALDSLLAQRDSAYDAIRDLDFDYQMGKLSQQDYESLRDKYRVRAAQILQQIDELAGKAGAEDRIEEEVARLRAWRVKPVQPGAAVDGDAIEQEIMRLRTRSRAAGVDGIENQVAKLRAARSAPRAGGDTVATFSCPQCHAPAHVGDQFCAQCGRKL